jgi:predicted acyl esterase
MKKIVHRAATLLVATVAFAADPAPQSDLPSDIPQKWSPVTAAFDFDRREAMIPMRDGVKLHTVILTPRGVSGAPILLTRTP